MTGNGSGWQLHPRLAADTVPVARWPLCDLLLMDDARFPWLILVPRIDDATEIVDLDASAQARLLLEVNDASRVLRTVAAPDKLNIAALGNIVRQLHIHVVGRRVDDAAWPGPVWGHGAAERYGDEARSARLQALRAACGPA